MDNQTNYTDNQPQDQSMKFRALAELISSRTKRGLFELFSSAREEAPQLEYDQFTAGIIMLLVEWRKTLWYESQSDSQGASKKKAGQRAVQDLRLKYDVQPAVIKYANRLHNPSRSESPHAHELKSQIRGIKRSGNYRDIIPRKQSVQSPKVIALKQSEFKAYIKEAPKNKPIFRTYLIPTSLIKQGQNISKKQRGK